MLGGCLDCCLGWAWKHFGGFVIFVGVIVVIVVSGLIVLVVGTACWIGLRLVFVGDLDIVGFSSMVVLVWIVVILGFGGAIARVWWFWGYGVCLVVGALRGCATFSFGGYGWWG